MSNPEEAAAKRSKAARAAVNRGWFGLAFYLLGVALALPFLSTADSAQWVGMIVMLISTLSMLGHPSKLTLLWMLLNAAVVACTIGGVYEMSRHLTNYPGYALALILPMSVVVSASMLVGTLVATLRRPKAV